MPLNHVISSSGLVDLILIHPIWRLHVVLHVKEKNALKKLNIEFGMALVIWHVLYETLKGVLISQGRKAELSQLPYMDVGMQRSDIILRSGGVSICVADCKEGQLKARLCIVLQSGRSIWAKKWENHKSFAHKVAALLSPPCLGFKHLSSHMPNAAK